MYKIYGGSDAIGMGRDQQSVAITEIIKIIMRHRICKCSTTTGIDSMCGYAEKS